MSNVEQTVELKANDRSKPRFWQEGLCLIVLGFTGPTLLYIVQLWLPTFGQQFIGMTESESLRLLVYYNVGSLVSVFVLVIVLRKWVKPVHIILIYPCISLFAFGALLLFKSQAAVIISSCVIGFSISGVLQLIFRYSTVFPANRILPSKIVLETEYEGRLNLIISRLVQNALYYEIL